MTPGERYDLNQNRGSAGSILKLRNQQVKNSNNGIMSSNNGEEKNNNNKHNSTGCGTAWEGESVLSILSRKETVLLVLHPLQPIVSTAKLCLLPDSPMLHLEELSCLQKRIFERGPCPENQQLPSCSSQGQGQRVHLCQIQLRLCHGLLIPEGHRQVCRRMG